MEANNINAGLIKCQFLSCICRDKQMPVMIGGFLGY